MKIDAGTLHSPVADINIKSIKRYIKNRKA